MISYCAVTTVKYFFLLFFQLLPVIRVVFNFRVELLWLCFGFALRLIRSAVIGLKTSYGTYQTCVRGDILF